MGRAVVVTGASRGIGRELVTRFAALGDEVVALARDERALNEVAAEHGSAVRAVVCDLTDERAVIDTMAGLGRIDVLVNNAGVSETAPLQKVTLGAWQRQMAVNATAAFLCTRAVIAGMRARDEGRILTVASTAGRVGVAYGSAYAASKHAAIGLMRSVAAELAGTRVTANAVCPTFVDSAMTRASVERIAAQTGRSLQQSAQALADMAPLGRLVTPAEVADAVIWLASPAAQTLSGQTLVLDGGGIQT